MIGTRVSAYEVLSELGSGGMGTVYLAECAHAAAGLDPSTKVALKVIHPNLSEPGFFKRFLREAQIGQDVRHENVVRTYDCDATDVAGAVAHFLVMEYVEGQTLRDLLDELERVPEELCRHIGCEVAKGLAAIHAAGVVHRDIKPENVLITAEHVVKVMDLGVARLQDEAIRLSQAGAFVGSLEYAAPEQFRAADGEPDGRADLHALGVVLYELATGQHPFRDADASRLMRNILDEEPRKAGEVNPQLSPFFEEVVGTLIAKDREQRFDSAAELVDVLGEGETGGWWKTRAKALRIETKRPLRRIRVPRETALYGRDDDLARLHALFDKAKAGDGQVLLVEGEAGIGKTRLMDEFVGQLRQEGEDINFLFGSYPPGGAATSAGAFSEAYREQFGAEGLEQALEGYLKHTPMLIPSFAAILKGETTPKHAEALTKDSLQTVFVHASRGLAAERTTIVLIDDLHFAPADGRALFTSLAMAVPGHRILLLGTMRPGIPADWVANVERLDQTARTVLPRLGPKDLARLLGDAFQSQRLAEQLAYQIGMKSDGNPFFAFEIIRGLREGQFISRQPDGTWVTTRVIEDIEVPSSVLELVSARVADLAESERDILDVASCFGFEFDPLLLAEVTGLPRIELLKRLGHIERQHRLVRALGRRFVFDHHQVQEALYGGLSDLLREEYHAAIGDAMESRHGARAEAPGRLDGSVCVALCEHFLKGGHGERALPYLGAAVDHLAEGHLHAQAVALTERALDAPPKLEGEDRLNVLLMMNAGLRSLGRPDAQDGLLVEARAIAEDLGDPGRLAEVESAVGGLRCATGRYEEAEAHVERELELLSTTGNPRAEATAIGHLGMVYVYQGRLDEAKEHIGRWIAFARDAKDTKVEAEATGELGHVYMREGRYAEAMRLRGRQADLARERGDRDSELAAIMGLGTLLALQGRFAQAETHLEQSLNLAREMGYRRMELATEGNLGTMHEDQGRYAAAVARNLRCLDLAREVNDRECEAGSLCNLGAVYAAQGCYEEAEDLLERGLVVTRAISDREGEAYAVGSLGDMCSSQGRLAKARVYFQRELDLARELGDRRNEAMALLRLGRLAVQEGTEDEAAAHLEAAAVLARTLGFADVLVRAQAWRAHLPGGDIDAARDALRECGDRAGPARAMEAHYQLFIATNDARHLAESKHLLDGLVEGALEEHREKMLRDVPLHRDIMTAWNERKGSGD